jgi:hypothetical protein
MSAILRQGIAGKWEACPAVLPVASLLSGMNRIAFLTWKEKKNAKSIPLWVHDIDRGLR